MTRPDTTRPPRSQKQAPQKQAQEPKEPSPSQPRVDLAPRAKLFWTLLLIFLVWIGFVVTLYFTTVFHKTDVHL